MLFTLIPAIVDYSVIANIGIQYLRVKYGMTFLMATGLLPWCALCTSVELEQFCWTLQEGHDVSITTHDCKQW